MIEKLKEVMVFEKNALSMLLRKLEEQQTLIASNKIFELEKCSKEIDGMSIEIAKAEVERRKLVGEGSFKELISKLNNDELNKEYKEISIVMDKLITQKEHNDLLLKQNLSFANSMLSALKPQNKRSAGAYNTYGKVKR